MKKNMLFLIFTLGFLCMGMQINASFKEMRKMSLEAQKKREEQVKKEKIALIKKIGPLKALKEQLKAAANQFNTIATRTLSAAKYHFPKKLSSYMKESNKDLLNFKPFNNDDIKNVQTVGMWIDAAIRLAIKRKSELLKNKALYDLKKDNTSTLKAALEKAINGLEQIGNNEIIASDRSQIFDLSYEFPNVDRIKRDIGKMMPMGSNPGKKRTEEALKSTKEWLHKARTFARKKAKNHKIFLEALEQVE